MDGLEEEDARRIVVALMKLRLPVLAGLALAGLTAAYGDDVEKIPERSRTARTRR